MLGVIIPVFFVKMRQSLKNSWELSFWKLRLYLCVFWELSPVALWTSLPVSSLQWEVEMPVSNWRALKTLEFQSCSGLTFWHLDLRLCCHSRKPSSVSHPQSILSSGQVRWKFILHGNLRLFAFPLTSPFSHCPDPTAILPSSRNRALPTPSLRVSIKQLFSITFHSLGEHFWKQLPSFQLTVATAASEKKTLSRKNANFIYSESNLRLLFPLQNNKNHWGLSCAHWERFLGKALYGEVSPLG